MVTSPASRRHSQTRSMFSVSATASRVHAAPAFVTKVSKVRIFDARRRAATTRRAASSSRRRDAPRWAAPSPRPRTRGRGRANDRARARRARAREDDGATGEMNIFVASFASFARTV